MTAATNMRVVLRLPTQTLFEGAATRLTARAVDGAFGLLPNHIDLVTALAPCLLLVETPAGAERVFGVDEGVLVKKGPAVDVAVRRGVESADLASLRDTVRRRFIEMDEEERVARTALSRLEADMVRRFAGLRTPAP